MKAKDAVLKELNAKYIFPSAFQYSLRKPALKLKKPELESTEMNSLSPHKGDPAEDSPDKEMMLSIKQQVAKLDEQKKKAFFRYYRWKNSLYNERNISADDSFKLLAQYHKEYMACCTTQEKEEKVDKPPLVKR